VSLASADRLLQRYILPAICVAGALALGGCTTGSTTPPTAATVPGATASSGAALPKPLRIMPLGDSLTQGGVDGTHQGSLNQTTINGYRLDLWKLMEGGGYTVDYVGPYQLGTSALTDQDEAGESGACIKAGPCGGKTMYPLTAGWLNTYNPDLVIVQGGGNDYTYKTTTQIEADMESWIQLLWQTKPNAKIVVSGATQYHPDYEALTKAYVDGLQAQGKPIRFVPFGETVGTAANTLDGTHPNAAGYSLWARELYRKIQQLYPR
jgi:lysophospholipase L1-like esterase